MCLVALYMKARLPQVPQTAIASAKEQEPVGHLNVCISRRRLSALGEAIGFESDGLNEHLMEPDICQKSVHVRRGLVTSVSFLSRVGKIPNNPNKVNQDRCWVTELLDRSGRMYKFCGVADGHGVHGHSVADMIRTQLGVVLEKQLSQSSDVKTALIQAHRKMSTDILDSYLDVSFSGTTSVSILLIDNRVSCANIGDSRAVVGSLKSGKWIPFALSTDHKPDLPEEQKRILSKGGRVAAYTGPKGDPVGPARVWLKTRDLPGLAMSRSFGDKIAASVGVSAEPEITEMELTSSDKILVLGSDGVWEFLSNQDAIDIVSPFYDSGDSKGASEALCARAEQRWQQEECIVDDITAVVLFF